VTFIERYHALITWIEIATGQPDTVLHIHAGLAVMMLARIVTKRSFATFVPFAFAVAAECANELFDYLQAGVWNAPGTMADLANTLFWPFAISLGVRWRPMILRDKTRIAA
jgi:hypothetical protein